MDRRHFIEAGCRAGWCRYRVDERARARAVGAEVHQPLDAQAQKATFFVNGEFPLEIGGTGVMVSRNGLGTRAGPAHRLAAALRRKQHCEKFWIDFVADAESAPDIVRVNAELASIETRDLRQRGFDVRNALRRNIDIVDIARGVMAHEAGLRLHRITGDALRGYFYLDDMRCLRKRPSHR